MKIISAKYLISSPNVINCPGGNLPEYAFIGRSNVGKSSLINYLCNNSNLSKTSKTPGKTKLINHFLINNNIYFVDLPGYGYAKTSKENREKWGQFISQYLESRSQLRCVFLLVDASISVQKIDLEFLSWIQFVNVPFEIIFTKIDKSKQVIVNKNIADFNLNLTEKKELFKISTKEKTEKNSILQKIENLK